MIWIACPTCGGSGNHYGCSCWDGPCAGHVCDQNAQLGPCHVCDGAGGVEAHGPPTLGEVVLAECRRREADAYLAEQREAERIKYAGYVLY